MDTVLPSGDSTTQSPWLVAVVGLAADGCLYFEIILKYEHVFTFFPES